MAFNSPLMDGHRDVTPADIIFACQVCAEEPLGQIGWRDKLLIMQMTRDPSRFQLMLDAFAEYVLVTKWPKFWEQSSKTKGGTSRGIPWPITIICNLIANGIDEKRAWEMPECQAIWYNSAFAVTKGADINIMSPEEEAYMAEEEAKEKAAAASNPAKETTP
jgi:hypothetical protein